LSIGAFELARSSKSTRRRIRESFESPKRAAFAGAYRHSEPSNKKVIKIDVPREFYLGTPDQIFQD
jgi:hypothetical protein